MWRASPAPDAGDAYPPVEVQANPEPMVDPPAVSRLDAPPGMTTSPLLVSLSTSEARQACRERGLRVWVDPRPSDHGPWDVVLEQDPPAGQPVELDGVITLMVRTTPSLVIPEFKGAEADQVEADLQALGLVPGGRTERRSDAVSPGRVLRTKPRAGASVRQGTRVSVVVATPRPMSRKRSRHERKRARVQWTPEGGYLAKPDWG